MAFPTSPSEGQIFENYKYNNGVWEEIALTDSSIDNKKRPAIDNTIIPKFIGEAYTNLVQDPCDLTTANWIGAGIDTPEDSGLTINGYKLWKITSNTTSLSYSKNINNIISDGDYVESLIFKKGTTDSVDFRIYDGTATVARLTIRIIFSTKNVSPTSGSVLRVDWLDNDTVQVFGLASGVIGANDNGTTFVIDNDGTYNIGDYVYMTMPQITKGTTMFPFVNGTHPKDVISAEFTMPDVFAVDMIVEPKFSYNSITHFSRLFEWYADSNNFIILVWNPTNHYIYIAWKNNGTEYQLISQKFDDGTSLTPLNQKLRVTLFLNFISGNKDGSRLTIIPFKTGSLYSDDSWSGNISINNIIYPQLHIGSDSSGNEQFESDYEYFNIYSWDGVKPTITSSDDADQYFQKQSMLFEAIPNAFIEKSISADIPLSSALQQVTNTLSSGVGIKDKAILPRHLYQEYVTATADTEITTQEVINVDAASATLTLHQGQPVGTRKLIRKINNGAGTITINSSGTEVFTRASLDHVTLTSDGDFWELEKVSATRWELIDGVESGSNSNGAYTKLSNGRLLEYKIENEISTTISETNVFGSTSGISYEAHITWTYPIAFISNPAITTSGGGNYLAVTVYSKTAVNCEIQIKSTTAINNILFDSQAVGRWYT